MNKLSDEVKEFVNEVKEILNIDNDYDYEVTPRNSNDVVNDIKDLFELKIDYNNILVNDNKKIEIEYK